MPEETVSLKEFFEKILLEKEKALIAALASAKEAVRLAEETLKTWMAGTNEWRQTMIEKDRLFARQVDVEALQKFKEEHSGVVSSITNLQNEIKILNTFKDNMQGKASQSALSVVTIISVISLLIAIVKFFV